MLTAAERLSTLTADQRQRLQSLLTEFNRTWDEGRLEAQARQLPNHSSLRLVALAEMVKIDLWRRWQRGRQALLESYLETYPELGRAETVPVELIHAEYQARRRNGFEAETEAFARRFPRQADDLRKQIEQNPLSVPAPNTHGQRASTHSTSQPQGVVEPPEQLGRYRIVKKLGQGGMGTVYLAHDTQLDRPVALKLPRFAAGDGPEILERFVREARAAATVQHSSICPVYDVGEVGGIHFVSMAYLEGNLLSELIRGGKPLPQRPAAAVVRKLALALEEAHRVGVIHRDLKPTNVMVNRRKEPIVMDFGLARRLNAEETRLTRFGDVMGTPAYMSPEQVRGDNDAVGPASDVYSLGVILYEMLTGSIPFRGPLTAVLGMILAEEPEPPSALRPGLDAALEAICLKAMAKKAVDRHPSMGDLAAALTRYLKSGSSTSAAASQEAEGLPEVFPAANTHRGAAPSLSTRPPTGVSPPMAFSIAQPRVGRRPPPLTAAAAANPSPPRRWPWVAVGAVTLGTLLLLGIAWLLLRPRPARETPPSELPSTLADADFSSDDSDKLDPSLPTVTIRQEIEVDAVGDSRFTAEIQLPAERYESFKRMMSPRVKVGETWQLREPKMANVLAYLELESAGALMERLDGSFKDGAIRVQGSERGWAKHRDGRWVNELTLDPGLHYRLIRKQGQAVTLRAVERKPQAQTVSEMRLTLPRGVHNIRVTNKPSLLLYEAPGPQASAGKGKPSMRLETKPHIMSALYKLYGDRRFEKLWVARAIFRNDSGETLTDYRVRFRLVGYSEWSRWERSDLVHPGQTVVDPFYPVIEAKARELKGKAPADVEVEYSFVRPNGQRVSDTHSERTTILGINAAVFSDLARNQDSTWFEMYKDSPLVLASFTSANDPVMQDVVGLLSRTIGGAPSSANDKAALLFLNALYDLMRVNIAYETTPGDVIDGLAHQHLKYGRDVLRTKSGTCVNTAIFYASVAEAAGMDAFLYVIPGHAFAAVRLPESGTFLFVETTGCGGGTWEKSLDFAAACKAAEQTFNQSVKDGRIIEVDIRTLRKQGVNPPELPDAGTNPLREWQIVAPRPPARQPDLSQRERPRTAPTEAAASPVAGVWDVTIEGKDKAVAVFHGNGTFSIGENLNKPLMEGRWAHTGETLALIVGDDKRDELKLTWSAERKRFTFTAGADRFTFQRKPISAQVLSLRQKQDVVRDGRKGMAIHLGLRVDNAPGVPCEALVVITNGKDEPLKAVKETYRSKDGYLCSYAALTPAFVCTEWKDLVLFLPYEAITAATAEEKLRFVVNIWCPREGRFLLPLPSRQDFTLKKSK